MNNQKERHIIQSSMHKRVYETLKKIKAFAAGGCMISIYSKTDINDIDIYVRNKEGLLELVDVLSTSGYQCMFMSDRSLVYAGKHCITINVIFFKYYNSLQEVFDTFDFENCKAGFDFESESVKYSGDFFKSNLIKSLIYTRNSMFPYGALFRLQKYFQKGYKMDRCNMLKLANDCSKIKINSLEDLEYQVGTMYGIDFKEVWKNEDGEFNVDKFLDKLENVYFDFDADKKQFIPQSVVQISLIDPENICQYDRALYYIWHGEITDVLSCEYEGKKTYKELEFPINLYKWVSPTIDPKVFKSFYKDFSYCLDTVAEDMNHGLHFTHFYNIKRATYSTEESRVMIEIEVKSADDVFDLWNMGDCTGCRVKKGRITRVVTAKEIEERFNKYDSRSK